MSIRTKNFYKWQVSIVLNDSFKENDEDSVEAHALSLYSHDMLFVLIVESRNLFSQVDLNIDDFSIDDYAQITIELNQLKESNILKKDGFTYYTYEKEIDGNSYMYYAFILKGSDAFYLCQFGCFSEKADILEPIIFEYVKTISIK